MNSCRIAVDTRGSETPTDEIIRGAVHFARECTDCNISFIGRPEDLREVQEQGFEVIDSPVSIGEHKSLWDVLSNERQSSMRTGLDYLAARRVDALVTTGYSGALMGVSRQCLPMLAGISRPALIKQFKGMKGSFWMLDLGANTFPKASVLVEFALMGSAYASALSHLKSPRVALLNIGSEANKGPQLLRDTAQLLSKRRDINFIGFMEADLLFSGQADVVVADGFAGNICLKSIEGAVGFATYYIQQAVSEAGLADHKIAQQVVGGVSTRLNSQSYNGASLIGLDGVVIKSHGRTDRVGIGAALKLAQLEVSAGVPKRLSAHFLKLEKEKRHS